MSLRLVFMGTPAFSVPVLDALATSGHSVVAVYSQPPKPAGRGLELTRSPVQMRAEALGIPVRTPVSLRTPEAQAEFAALQGDLAIVIAYGLILPRAVLAAPRLGCVNLHASLLPRWRGAAPIQRAIMAGDPETGVEVMQMAEGLDTGPVMLTARMAIGPDETTGELHDRLSLAAADLIVTALAGIEAGTLVAVPQADTGVTYAKKIDKGETRIDWNQPAQTVHDHIRGLSPFPGAWCDMPFGQKRERVKILRSERVDGSGPPGTVLDDRLTIACASDAVRLIALQKAGGKPLDAASFQRGAALTAGVRLD